MLTVRELDAIKEAIGKPIGLPVEGTDWRRSYTEDQVSLLALVAEVERLTKEHAELQAAAVDAWHQLNSAGLNPEQYKALSRLYAAAKQ